MQVHIDGRLRPMLGELAVSVESAFKILLEQKHLYQNLEVDFNSLASQIERRTASHPLSKDERSLQLKFLSEEIAWTQVDPSKRMLPVQSDPDREPIVVFNIHTVKLYCSECKRVEAFNLIAASELFEMFKLFHSVREDGWNPEGPNEQLFNLSFQCLACKSLPNVFLIRRKGCKLAQNGRSPMEQFPSPSYIPKEVRKYYSDARVAHDSGQVLASLFLLRVLVEQFTRKQSNKDYPSADKYIDEYTASLPDDFKQRFPSLRDIYSKLSDAIHSADESAGLFERSTEDIEKHFDARRLFGLG